VNIIKFIATHFQKVPEFIWICKSNTQKALSFPKPGNKRAFSCVFSQTPSFAEKKGRSLIRGKEAELQLDAWRGSGARLNARRSGRPKKHTLAGVLFWLDWIEF